MLVVRLADSSRAIYLDRGIQVFSPKTFPRQDSLSCDTHLQSVTGEDRAAIRTSARCVSLASRPMTMPSASFVQGRGYDSFLASFTSSLRTLEQHKDL